MLIERRAQQTFYDDIHKMAEMMEKRTKFKSSSSSEGSNVPHREDCKLANVMVCRDRYTKFDRNNITEITKLSLNRNF